MIAPPFSPLHKPPSRLIFFAAHCICFMFYVPATDAPNGMIGSELVPDVGIIVSTVEATGYTRRARTKKRPL